MIGGPRHPVLRFLRSIALSCGDAGAPDEDLLVRFATNHDEAAFAGLVRRHGPMVLGVCARVLGDTPEAEDAFQAAFLVLARRARSLYRPELLPNWLYGVAYRTALKVRATAARRRAAERQVNAVTGTGPLDELIRRDLQFALDEELSRLPEKYRVPIVLCYLDGQTHEEAACRLGCPRKTVTTRLARGCDHLRARLTRRGVGLATVSVAAALLESAQALPPVLLETTIQAALTGAVPAGVAALAKEVLMSMFLGKLKWVALLLLAVCALGVPAIALNYAATAGERPQEKKLAAPQPAAAATDDTKDDMEALQGGWEGQSAQQDGKAVPEDEAKKMRVSIKGDRMMLIPGGEWTPLKIKLGPAKSPKVLYITATEGADKDKPVPAIYRLDKEADTLTLCFDAKEGKAVPKDFAAKKGSGLMLLVLKHELRPPSAADPNRRR